MEPYCCNGKWAYIMKEMHGKCAYWNILAIAGIWKVASFPRTTGSGFTFTSLTVTLYSSSVPNSIMQTFFLNSILEQSIKPKKTLSLKIWNYSLQSLQELSAVAIEKEAMNNTNTHIITLLFIFLFAIWCRLIMNNNQINKLKSLSDPTLLGSYFYTFIFLFKLFMLKFCFHFQVSQSGYYSLQIDMWLMKLIIQQYIHWFINMELYSSTFQKRR